MNRDNCTQSVNKISDKIPVIHISLSTALQAFYFEATENNKKQMYMHVLKSLIPTGTYSLSTCGVVLTLDEGLSEQQRAAMDSGKEESPRPTASPQVSSCPKKAYNLSEVRMDFLLKDHFIECYNHHICASKDPF